MDFFIIANAWSAGKDNPTSKHRIALELVRQGHRVLWIEGSGMRTPSVGSSSDRLRMVKKVLSSLRGARALPPALWLLAPLFIPLPRYELVRRLNGLICRAAMRFWGWRLGFRDPVLINYVPVLAEAMRHCQKATTCGVEEVSREGAKARSDDHPSSFAASRLRVKNIPRVVYHCVDRWDAFAMYDSAMMGEMDRRCCRYADLVIASAGELYDRCKAINPNTVLIPHGVDWEHFRRATCTRHEITLRAFAASREAISCGGKECLTRSREASEEERGASASGGENNAPSVTSLPSVQISRPAGPMIGFFGLLSEWVDQDLLLRLAREFPGATLQLIGKADVDVSRLQGQPNIQLTGPKPFADLPGLIAQFTVGLIPFTVNDLTRSVNPIKLREMLSAGCPVVSTALPEVERLAPSATPPAVAGCSVVKLLRECPAVSVTSSSTTQQPNNLTTVPVTTGTRHLQVARSHDEFVDMVRRILEAPLTPDQRLALSDSMAEETWSAKVKEILSLLTPQQEGLPSAPCPHVIHLAISLDHGGLERLVVDWTNARNRQHPGSTMICCLDKPGELTGQVEGGIVMCLEAVRSRRPFDLDAVRRLRRMLTPPGSQAGETPAPQQGRSFDPSLKSDSSSQALPKVWGGCPHPPCASQVPPGSQASETPAPQQARTVLHTHNAAAWQYGVLACLGTGIRHVHTEHGTNPHSGGLVNRLRNALLWRMTDEIVVVAETVAEHVSRGVGIPRNRLKVIPNGIWAAGGREQEAGSRKRRELGIPAGARVIGSVGRLAQVKGFDRLLNAFSRMSCEPTLLLVGDGPERATLEQQARDLGIVDRVIFAGYQADPWPCYAAMDLFVLPSHSEGLSISLLEAMSAGIPVAVTDVGENRAILDKGALGLILPEDEGQWPALLSDLLFDPTTPQRVAAAQERVRSRYSLKATLAGYEGLYRSC